MADSKDEADTMEERAELWRLAQATALIRAFKKGTLARLKRDAKGHIIPSDQDIEAVRRKASK